MRVPGSSDVRFLDDPSRSLTVRRSCRPRLVGSDTEEDGGSTPPAPTTPILTSAYAKAHEFSLPTGDSVSPHSGKTALYCLRPPCWVAGLGDYLAKPYATPSGDPLREATWSLIGLPMGLPGGRGSPIGRRGDRRGYAACPARTLRLARLAAITASPATSARAAASTPSDATSQPGCPLGSPVRTGAGTWAGVPLGMEKRSRASCRRRAASAAVCCREVRIDS
jgi:hypothetical protein